VGTSETRVAPPRAQRSTAAGSNAGRTSQGAPVTSARVTTDSPPTWESGRHASQRSVLGSTPTLSLVAIADARTAS
jgi:hypothetical protein